jgi:hypothetical protein
LVVSTGHTVTNTFQKPYVYSEAKTIMCTINRCNVWGFTITLYSSYYLPNKDWNTRHIWTSRTLICLQSSSRILTLGRYIRKAGRVG